MGESAAAYEQPLSWWGLELNATFQHTESGVLYQTPGFWDGGLTWKVRFAAPVAGEWNFTTSFSETNNSGLHGQIGSFFVTEYDGENPLYQHGFLRPHESGRFLEHADGTPFYWLGDTHWSGFSTAEHWNDTN